MAVLMDGKAVSAAVRGRIRLDCEAFTKKFGRAPGLSVILVGNDPASCVYVRNKKRACEEVGFSSSVYELPGNTTQEELLLLIDRLNRDPAVDGILVQLPLPAHLDEKAVTLAIRPEKDVDAFHPINVGAVCAGEYTFVPCTPAGVMELLAYYGIDPAGKDCVVIGRSNIVGKPQALLLLEKNATVTVCHSRTVGLAEHTRRADILVSAVGKAGFVRADMVKPGAVVIDVGMNRNAEGKLCGDVDFPAVEPLCSYITPVPGGVGPMTITMLLPKTLTAAEKNLANQEKAIDNTY